MGNRNDKDKIKMLPKLPKQYKRKEASITPLVMKWFKENYPESCAVEVKVKGGSVLSHQKLALSEVKGAFTYKIPDSGRKNPFDFFMLKNSKVFVVICDGMKCHAEEITGDDEFPFYIGKRKTP